MARLGAAAPLLLLLARARADEGSKKTYGMTPHEVATLDWTFAPFKGLISKYLVNIFPNAPRHTAEEVKKDFINYTRMFHSDDFPRDLTRPYAGIPLFIYVSVLILVAWIIISIFFCCFRCCCRKTKCCTPVLYGPRKNRRKNERKCCVVYFIGLLLFITTTVLHVVVILLIPKLGKQATNDVIEPLYVYAKVLPDKLGKIPSELPESIGTIVGEILNKIDLEPLGTRLGNMADFQLEYLEEFIKDLAEILSSNKQDMKDIEDQITGLIGDLETISTEGLEDYLGNNTDGINSMRENLAKYGEDFKDYIKYFDIEGLLDIINKKIEEYINNLGGSDTEGSEGDDESNAIQISELLNLTGEEGEEGLLDSLKSCIIDLVNESESSNSVGVFECVLKNINQFLNTEYLSDFIETSTSGLTNGLAELNSIADAIKGYLDEYGDVISIVLKIITGESDDILADVAKIFEKFSGSEEGDESGQSFEDMIDQLPSGLPKVVRTAGKALKYTKWIVLGSFVLVMVLFYILPVSMALCLRKRNRREGKCQCKCWIKCSTCFCTAWLPTVFIIVSIFGFIGVFLYLTMVGLILNTDKSNFKPKKVGNEDIPAPMGEAFVDCATNGYIDKEKLIDKFVDINDLNVEGALKDIVGPLIEELKAYAGDLVPGLLLCKDSTTAGTATEVKKTFTDEDKERDYKMIDKYGTFFTALQLDSILDTTVKAVLTVQNLGNLLKSFIDPEGEVDTKYDPLLYYIATMVKEFAQNIPLNGLKETITKIDPTEELQGIKEEIVNSNNKVDALYSVIRTTASFDGEDMYVEIPDEVKIKVGDEEIYLGDLVCRSKDVIKDEGQGDWDDAISSLIEGCNDDKTWKKQKVSLVKHSFFDILEYLSEVLDSSDEEVYYKNAFSEFVSLVAGEDNKYTLRTNTANLKDILTKAITVINSIINFIGGLLSSINELQTDGDAKGYEDYHDKISSVDCPDASYCWVGISALLTILKSSVDGLVSALRGLDKHEFLSGMLSCYPVAVMTEGVVGVANSVSVLYTLDELALFFLAVGCLIMMVAANMGPIVYHVRYKYKCCCCCHKKGWETDPDNGGSRGRQNNRRRDPEVVRRSMNNNNMVVQPSNINIYDPSSAYQPSQQSVTVSFSVAGNAQSQQQYMYGSESNMPHRNNGYYNSQAQSSVRNSHYSSRPMYSDRDYYSNIDGSSMIVK